MKQTYVDDRESIIRQYAKWKDVLDFWVWDTSDRFLHKIIAESANSVVGIELDAERTEKLKKHWYNIIQWNAEHIDLEKQFDVVIAWDLIEHLNNVWLFLENVKKHLKKDGYFLFNTPNAYAINFLIRWIIFGWNVKQFPEHVTIFTEELISNLLERYWIKLEKTIYFSHKENNVLSYIIKLFSKISKKWNENMLFVCKL